VAVQDHTGGVANAKGLAVPKLLEHVAKTGGVAGFKGGEAITSAADFWAWSATS
jgi:glutamate dehydrogenase (NAD(P)+)